MWVVHRLLHFYGEMLRYIHFICIRYVPGHCSPFSCSLGTVTELIAIHLHHTPHPLREPTSRTEIGSYFLNCSCLPFTPQSTGNLFPAGVWVTVDIDVYTCIDQLPLCGALATDILQYNVVDQPPPNLLSPAISHLLHHSK